jgi:hypothetical protein
MLLPLIYLLCLLTSAGCMWLLFRAWRRTGSKMLMWSALCFVCLALNNIVVFVDVVVLPDVEGFQPLRQLANLAAIGVLLWGFIWEAD